jgi:Ca-activated chloride channel family protein
MTFANPGWLLFALVLCIGSILTYRLLSQRKTVQALAYTDLTFLREAAGAPAWPERFLLGGLVLAAALLGTAPAGPHLTTLVPAKDGTAILCVDTSGSMSAQDVAPTRADASKAAARRFIDEVPAGTKVGIVAFSTGAGVVQAPTGDKAAALDAVDRIPLPNGATAIGDALALAAQQLPEKGHRVVVLITDGVNNRGVDPMEAAKFLASRHVPVYTVGIGTNDSGQLIPGTTEPATIDEDALRALAAAGGGTYARADSATQLQNALSQLGRTTVLEKKKIDASFGFAIAGGFLLLLTIFGGWAAGRFP